MSTDTSPDPAAPGQLTAAEADLLAEAEAVIERGIQTFVEVGDALMSVRDNRLYRGTYATFDQYCRQRWGFSDSRARQLIGASQTVTNVTDAGLPAPVNEGQARALGAVSPDERAEVWAETLERTGGKPTAAAVAETVQARPVWRCAGCGLVAIRTRPPANCAICKCPAFGDLAEAFRTAGLAVAERHLVWVPEREAGTAHHRLVDDCTYTACDIWTAAGHALPFEVITHQQGHRRCDTCWPSAEPAAELEPVESGDVDDQGPADTGWHCLSCGRTNVDRPQPCPACGSKTGFLSPGAEPPYHDVDADGHCSTCASPGNTRERVYTPWLRDGASFCRLRDGGKKTICGAQTGNGHIVTRGDLCKQFTAKPCEYGCWPAAAPDEPVVFDGVHCTADAWDSGPNGAGARCACGTVLEGYDTLVTAAMVIERHVAEANADATADEDEDEDEDDETPEVKHCEKCGTVLDGESALMGYLRCEDCDSQGDHVSIDGGPCQVCAPDDHAAEKVWMAADRRGLAYHRLVGDARTSCDRTFYSGRVMTRGEAVGEIGGKPCRMCWPDGDAASAPAAPELQAPVEEVEPVEQPDAVESDVGVGDVDLDEYLDEMIAQHPDLVQPTLAEAKLAAGRRLAPRQDCETCGKKLTAEYSELRYRRCSQCDPAEEHSYPGDLRRAWNELVAVRRAALREVVSAGDLLYAGDIIDTFQDQDRPSRHFAELAAACLEFTVAIGEVDPDAARAGYEPKRRWAIEEAVSVLDRLRLYLDGIA